MPCLGVRFSLRASAQCLDFTVPGIFFRRAATVPIVSYANPRHGYAATREAASGRSPPRAFSAIERHLELRNEPLITIRKESEPPRVPRVLYPSPKKWRMNVDREHVKGAADKVKGAIKDSAGKITGDKKLQTEGKIDKAKGAAHNVAGDVKDAVRHADDD
jgi:uncharacterized protein YjbJ (UPF0337 family)